MTTRAIVALGIGQCVNWGVLYYAFGVLLGPIEQELHVPAWVVAGAFSTALFMAAVIAPTVGMWSDRGFAPRLIRWGGFAAAALLVLWALVPGLPALYVVWAALGLCMAATLYETAFVVVGRAVVDSRERLRALATVTVFGGLASTVFLPVTAALSQAWGWRPAVALLAGTLAVSTFVTSKIALPEEGTGARGILAGLPPAPFDRRFRQMLGLFSVASLSSTAFTTTVVPALVARDMTPTTSAMLGGLLGLMQLPGRALLMHGALNASPSRLLVTSLLLQASGLVALVFAHTPPAAAAGVALFAVGAGLTTLIRPHLVQTIFSIERAGHLNGVVARAQGLARAVGPVAAVGAAGIVGYGAVFGLLASVMVGLALTWHLAIDV